MTMSEQRNDWLVGGGEAGDLIRSMDWSATPFGPRDRWPESLRFIVQLIVESGIPMAVLWGPELVLLHNDAYSQIGCDSHPRAMGRPTREIWAEVSHITDPIHSAVLGRGETIYLEDQLLLIQRQGRMDEAHFTVCYSPIRSDEGLVGGCLLTLLETTRRVEALQSSERRHARLFESGIQGVIYWNMAGRITDANDRFLSMVGYDRADLAAGRVDWVQMTPPEYRHLDEHAMEELRRTGVDTPYEKEYIRKDGTRVPILVGAAMLDDRGHDGVAFVLDISARKRAEEALRDSEERLARILDNIHDALMIDDEAGQVVFANDQFLRVFGLDRDDIPGLVLEDYVAPAYRAELRERHNRRMQGHSVPTHFEYEGLRKDGRRMWLEVDVVPIRDATGRVTHTQSAIRDVSERRRAEQALRASEEKFSKAFLGSAAAVTITRLHDGAFIDLNPAYTRITGYSREDLLGKSAPPVWACPGDRAEFVRALREHGSVETLEVHLVRKDGREWTGLVSAQLISLGGEDAVISSILDITDRQRAEAELKAREADLREVLGQLAETDRRKDEFIAILSHELRNPLAPIRFALPVLQARHLDETGRRTIAVIDRQVNHLTRLVDDLLDVSRITRGEIQLQRDHVTLGSVVDSAVEAAFPAMTAARHTLEVSVPDDPIWLHADAARLAQVITNLLNNSAKYTPRGGRIWLTARCEHRSAVLRVRDSGVGIPGDQLVAVFEMFRQVNRPEAAQGGLGIGLALAKRLLEMHGGSIEAHSAGAGQGSEFIVRLPTAEEGRCDSTTQSGALTLPAGRTLKVLIVDDNADLVEMLAMLVETSGHAVRKALDGRSALSAALSFRPDVVLLDLGLPIMSGLDVARELRRRNETARAYLVALTGWGQAEDRRQTEEAGFDDHLTKPADPEALRRLLDRQAAERL